MRKILLICLLSSVFGEPNAKAEKCKLKEGSCTFHLKPKTGIEADKTFEMIDPMKGCDPTNLVLYNPWHPTDFMGCDVKE